MAPAITHDDYANSMFRFERLHPRWIDNCARYLRHVLGPAIEGATFLDYGFGRGNWSLAALRAGAARVIAVDAAPDNVSRFSDYCRAEGVGAVEIRQGNVLAAPLGLAADILWVYGVLPCVAEPVKLLSALGVERRDDDAIAILYAYDRGSFRQMIVEAARAGCRFGDEANFAAHSYLFTPRARLRARDDLTADVACWYTAEELAHLAHRSAYRPLAQFDDFGTWANPAARAEFAPHVLLCGFSGNTDYRPTEPARPLAQDVAVLAALAAAVMDAADALTRRHLAIGLFNTHFSAMVGPEPATAAAIEDFLFLMHGALRLGIERSSIPSIALRHFDAALAAMQDAPRRLTPELIASSRIAAFLEANTVRF